jgi:hypothetical protein
MIPKYLIYLKGRFNRGGWGARGGGNDRWGNRGTWNNNRGGRGGNRYNNGRRNNYWGRGRFGEGNCSKF